MRREQTRQNPGNGTESPFRGLTGKKKIALILLIAATITVSVMLIQFIRYSGYRLLYADLSHRDMALVTSWLDVRNIGFRTKNYGRDIYIEADRIYQTRIEISRELLSGSTGSFEVAAPSGLGQLFSGSSSTDTAVQRELARTIASHDAFDSARVFITFADAAAINSPFGNAGSSGRAHASVFLKRTPGKSISSDELTWVTKLVSQAVADLDPDQVDIFDSYGRLLVSGDSADDHFASSSRLLQHQKSIENHLQQLAGEAVDALLGPGRAMVKVAVTLDQSQLEATSESYDPERTTVKKEHTEFAPGSSYSAPEQTDQIQYIPPVPTVSSVDYEVSRTVTKTTRPAGTIERIGVAIFVGGKPVKHDDGSISYTTPNEGELQSLESVVSRVLSLQPDRGDAITVIPIPARTEEAYAPPEMVKSVPYEIIVPVVKTVLMIVGFGLLYLLIVRPVLTILTRGEDVKISVADTDPSGLADERSQPDRKEDFTSELKDEILKNPAPTAHIIKNWLQDT